MLGRRHALWVGGAAIAIGLLVLPTVFGVGSPVLSPTADLAQSGQALQAGTPVAPLDPGDSRATTLAPLAPTSPPAPTIQPTAVPQPTPAPTPAPTPTVTPAVALDPGRVGLQIRAPVDGARVPESLVVGGVQEGPTPPDRHLWAFVKADVPGARWYPWHRGEIITDPDNTWAIDLYLGGTAGTRHEVQVGTVDDALHTALTTFMRDNPNEPLPNLPAGFVQDASITVTLE